MRSAGISRVVSGALLWGALALTAASGARAETGEIRLMKQVGIASLTLAVMEHEKIYEKHLAATGLSATKVSWTRLVGGNVVNDAILSGNLDFAVAGIVPSRRQQVEDRAGVREAGSRTAARRTAAGDGRRRAGRAADPEAHALGRRRGRIHPPSAPAANTGHRALRRSPAAVPLLRLRPRPGGTPHRSTIARGSGPRPRPRRGSGARARPSTR